MGRTVRSNLFWTKIVLGTAVVGISEVICASAYAVAMGVVSIVWVSFKESEIVCSQAETENASFRM